MANNSIKKMVELAVNITAKGFEKSGTTINGLATRLKTAAKHALELSKALGMNGLGGTIRQLTGLTAALGGVFTLTSKQIKSLAKAFVDKGSSIKEVKDAIEITAGSINDYKQQIKSLDEQINNSKIGSKQYNELLKERIRLVGLLNAAEAQKREQIGKSSRVIDSQAQKEKELIAQQKKWAKEQDADALKRRNQRKEQIAQRQALLNGGTAQVAQDEQISSSTNKKAKATMGFSERIQTAIKWVGAYFVAGQAFLQIQRLLSFVFIDSIKAFINYENELKKLQAITGASVEEVNELSQAAINLAKSTVFTSTEIVELQKQLAKLGFSVSEIKDAQAGIAAFAQVTGVTIDQSAELVGKAIRAFNLSASSSQRIVNTFITGINKSALSGEYLATSMQYVASIGDQLNASVEMVTASLGILANAGFTASRAGTGLRLIFTEVGSAGEDLTETMRRLKEENISLSEAKQLVGQRGAGALLTLINRYEEVNDLVEEANDLTKRFASEMITLSSSSSILKQLGVVIEEANKSTGQWLYSTLGIESAVFRIINNIEQYGGVISGILNLAGKTLGIGPNVDVVSMTTSRLQLSKIISKANEDEIKQLLSMNISVDERSKVLGQIIERQYESNEISKSEYKNLKSSLATRINMLAILEGEAFNNRLITKTNEERDKIYEKQKQKLSQVFDGVRTYQESVAIIDSDYISITAEMKKQEFLQEELSKQIEQIEAGGENILEKDIKRLPLLKLELAAINGQVEGYKQMLNLYTDLDNIKAFAQNLDTEKKFNDAINERIVAQERLRSLQRQSAEDIAMIFFYEKEIDYLTQLRDKIYGVDKGSGAGDRMSDEIVKIAEISKFASMSTEQLVNEFIRLNEQLDHAKKIGDSYGIAEAALGLESLVNYLLPTVSGRLDEFSQIYGRIFIGDNAEKELERVSSFFKDAMDYYEKGVNDFISSAEKTNEAWNKLGGFSKWILSEFTDMSEDTIQKYAEAQVRVAQQFKKTATEAVNAINESIQANLDSEIRAVEARYSYEEKRYKAMLDANIINQQQYEKKLEKLEKERVEKTNEIERKRFNANKLNSIAEAAIETAIAMIRAETWVERLLVGILGATQIGIIGAQQYTPTQFEKGGVVEGRSHAEGGVPFTVRGRGGYEMEGGEFIVNKKATQKNLPLLEQINAGATTVSSRPMRESRSKYADGGMVGGDMTMLLAEIRNELKRPVRAYVSERELIGKMNERVDIKKRSAR